MFGEIEIETIGGCNRVCAACLRQTHPDRRRLAHRFGKWEVLPEETIRSIIDQAVAMDFRGRLNLQFFDEPLLDRRIGNIGRYAKAVGHFSSVQCYSNFDLLTAEKAADLDGAFDVVWVALYDRKIGGEPLVEGVEDRIAQIRSMFHQTVIAWTGGGHMVTHYSPRPSLADDVAAHRKEPCLYDAQERLIIDHRGEMLMCCDDIGGEFNLGNINNATLADLWYSEKHQAIVTALAKPGGRAGYPFCAECPR